MVAILAILDGASEPLRDAPTSLERAHMPVLDAVAAAGALRRVRTVPPGLAPGSETAIPTLLGWVPPAPVDRGMLEAAARGIHLAPGEHAWRVDVHGAGGVRAGPDEVARARRRLSRSASAHRIVPIGGHRLLAVGPPPPPVAWSHGLRLWPAGVVPPRVLDDATVMVAARGAAAGAARLMGAALAVPPGATGSTDTDLAAKARAAVSAVAGGARRVVVHVGAADEAAHDRDTGAKVAALERIDAELLGPLLALAHATAATLDVAADHGCDPRDGTHDATPVPWATWPAPARTGGPARFTERAVAGLPSVAPPPASSRPGARARRPAPGGPVAQVRERVGAG